MDTLDRILKRIEQGFVAILLLIITAILFVNVILRMFGSAIDWAEEFSRYGIIWITFIGSSICIYKGAHIGIDAITSFFSDRGKKNIALITIGISVVFTLILLLKTFKLTQVVFVTNQLSSTLEVPMLYVYGAMPIGSLLMFIRFIQQFVKVLKTPANKLNKVKEEEC